MKCKKLAVDACLFETALGSYLVELQGKKYNGRIEYSPVVYVSKMFLKILPYWSEVHIGTIMSNVPQNEPELIAWFKQAVERYEEGTKNKEWFEV